MPKIDSSVIPANVINNIKLQRALVVEREWMESLLSRGIERSCIAAYLKVLNDYPLVFKHAGRHIIIDNGVVYRYSFDTSESAMDFFSSDVEHHGERTFDDAPMFFHIPDGETRPKARMRLRNVRRDNDSNLHHERMQRWVHWIERKSASLNPMPLLSSLLGRK